MTIKELGNRIRRDLAAAQRSGVLPDQVAEYASVRFDVRVSNPAAGPKVSIKIGGVDALIPNYPHHSPADCKRWMDDDGVALLAEVEKIANRYNPPDRPVYEVVTKFGPIFLAAEVTGSRIVAGPAGGQA